MAQQKAADPDINGEVNEDDLAAVRRLQEACGRLSAELGKAVVGQKRVVEELMIALLGGGHCLLEGVPGLAKTLLVRTLAQVLALSFKRIQFTPDLMPSDIVGTDIIREDRASGERHFVFIHGPVFSNIVLADEINRTPPKTQAALLEAMQEHRVTASGKEYVLPEPFFVLATQNPIEQEGTYPLPEAQLDRFMFHIRVRYPSFDEEMEIVRSTTSTHVPELTEVLSGEDILRLQGTVRRVPVPEHVYRYAVTMVRRTRAEEADAPDYIREWVSWGAGPRASQYLVLGAKARAILNGRSFAFFDDVAAVAHAVLRHRILVNFNAEAEGEDPDGIVDRLLQDTPRFEE